MQQRHHDDDGQQLGDEEAHAADPPLHAVHVNLRRQTQHHDGRLERHHERDGHGQELHAVAPYQVLARRPLPVARQGVVDADANADDDGDAEDGVIGDVEGVGGVHHGDGVVGAGGGREGGGW